MPREPTLAMAAAGNARPAALPAAAGPGRPTHLNVLMVNNPQMTELQKLTAAHFSYEEAGIKVNFTVLPENDVREERGLRRPASRRRHPLQLRDTYLDARNGWLHEMNS
ncbi:hypothetical protein SALBM311S_12500 [Streptomyces alboniger]